MKKPTNQIAEIIQKLEQENWMAQNSIDHFKSILDKNVSAISELEPSATWEEVPDEINGIPVEQLPQQTTVSYQPVDSNTSTPTS
jgi:hypothetical protein